MVRVANRQESRLLAFHMSGISKVDGKSQVARRPPKRDLGTELPRRTLLEGKEMTALEVLLLRATCAGVRPGDRPGLFSMVPQDAR